MVGTQINARYVGWTLLVINQWGSRIEGSNNWGKSEGNEIFEAWTYTSANNARTYVRAQGRVGASYTANYKIKTIDWTSKGKTVHARTEVSLSSYPGGFRGAFSEHSHDDGDNGTPLKELVGAY